MKYLLTFFCLISTYVAKAELALIANCKEGEGCSFELSDFDMSVMDVDFDRPIESDDIIVYGVKDDGTIIMYLDKKSRERIDREWGGDGYTKIDIFNPALLPQSGTWKVDFGNTTGNDCYGIGNIGSYIRKNMNTAGPNSGNVQFEHPFKPSKLFPSDQMKWYKTGYATYKGILDFNHGMSSPMKMNYFIHIINPTRIESYYTIEIKIPTKAPCIGKIPVNFTLIKSENKNKTVIENDLYQEDLLPIGG